MKIKSYLFIFIFLTLIKVVFESTKTFFKCGKNNLKIKPNQVKIQSKLTIIVSISEENYIQMDLKISIYM